MTFRDGDTFYPHHPDTVPAGDYCVNNRPGDTWYLVVDELTAQGIAWDILNELLQGTSWHIHPATIPYIAQFIINELRGDFDIDALTSEFDISPVGTNFAISQVIEDDVSLKPIDIDTLFVIEPTTFAFTLTDDLTSDFKITRVINNTRTP